MTLHTSELKRFFANASTIRGHNILPILSYIKVDKNRIYKTSTTAWVVTDITPVEETILIDEKVLSGLVKVTSADTIEVTVKGTVVHLTDGKHKARCTLSNDVDHYPQFPQSDKENEVRLESPVLKAIGVAVKNIKPSVSGGIVDPLEYVHLSKNYVFASDIYRFYTRRFEELPTISIDSICANIISQYGAATYYTRGNYNFFEIGAFLFGFAKPELTIPNFESFLKVFGKKEYMEFDVSELLNFLAFLSDQTQSDTVTVDFNGTKVSFFDEDLQVGDEIELEVEGTFRPKVMLLPKILSPLLKSLGKDTLRMSPLLEGQRGMHFWDDNDESLNVVQGEASKAQNQ